MSKLLPHQQKAVSELQNGSILCGGVGTGKTRTALAYYKERVLGSLAPGSLSLPLYVITTAKKRDSKDWEEEAKAFDISLTVDSWNNIKKYVPVKHAMFIFDEQRLVGNGVWVKSFYKIARQNQWILLTATPGNTWMDYIPVFVANGYFKNRTDFIDRHVVYKPFSKFPQIDHFVGVSDLMRLRKSIVVPMTYKKHTLAHTMEVWVSHKRSALALIRETRWNPYENRPIRNISEYCYVLRRVVNSDADRLSKVMDILAEHPKAIIFYNYDYELESLRTLPAYLDISISEWNGHKHELLPKGDRWVYLVQYTAGCEGWNCTETDTMIFYSLNYSFKVMAQAEGRIDRLNTPYTDLYYYRLVSRCGIDLSIRRALSEEKSFNESIFAGKEFRSQN